MKLESPAFKNKEHIPSKYTCDGEDINPPLKISGVPEKAKSLVLLVDDPDAPGKTFIHWLVWNIPAQTKQIQEHSAAEGAIEGINDFGKPGYGGPCPPSDTHRYRFKLYALDKMLEIDSSAACVNDLENAMKGHILARTQLLGLYYHFMEP